MKNRAFIHGVLLGAMLGAVAAAQPPPGLRPALAATRHEIAGFSVQVPGKGWMESRSEQGVLFFKRIDATESYHAGLSVTPAPPISSPAELAALAARLVHDQPDNPRYKIVRNEQTAGQMGALALVRGRTDFEDSGAVNLGQHRALATQNAYLVAWDPRRPGELVRVWFSWRGKAFDDRAFPAEAEKFFASFRGTGANAGK